jgi:hypothetical protein
MSTPVLIRERQDVPLRFASTGLCARRHAGVLPSAGSQTKNVEPCRIFFRWPD